MEYRGYDSAGICSQMVDGRPVREKDDFVNDKATLDLVKVCASTRAACRLSSEPC